MSTIPDEIDADVLGVVHRTVLDEWLRDGYFRLDNHGALRGHVTVEGGIVVQADEGLTHMLCLPIYDAIALDNARLIPPSSPPKKRTEIAQ